MICYFTTYFYNREVSGGAYLINEQSGVGDSIFTVNFVLADTLNELTIFIACHSLFSGDSTCRLPANIAIKINIRFFEKWLHSEYKSYDHRKIDG